MSNKYYDNIPIRTEKKNEDNIKLFILAVSAEASYNAINIHGRGNDLQRLMDRKEVHNGYAGIFLHPELPFEGFMYETKKDIERAFKYFDRFFTGEGSVHIMDTPVYVEKKYYEMIKKEMNAEKKKRYGNEND